MKIKIQKQEIEITAKGGEIIVKAECGECIFPNAYKADCVIANNKELAQVALCCFSAAYLGNDIKSFDKWEELFYSGGEPGDLEAVERDRKDFEYEQLCAKKWQAVSDIKAKDVAEYLEKRFHL